MWPAPWLGRLHLVQQIQFHGDSSRSVRVLAGGWTYIRTHCSYTDRTLQRRRVGNQRRAGSFDGHPP
jgi:hypothetical protein